MSKVWLITGASRGLGREWAIAALDRGDAVVAAVRNVDAMSDLQSVYGDRLLTLPLDVTDRLRCVAVADAALARFGRIDIVVNNAGYGQFGMLEELSEQEIRSQLDTNLLGALWMTQAVLPHLRRQASGHIVQVSSIGGITAFAELGIYHASKWALEGFSQSLALEVAGFGIKVTLVEPGSYSTDWGDVSARHATPLPAYAPVRSEIARVRAARKAGRGDPLATRAAILAVVDAADPPLRVFFGNGPLAVATREYESRLATWRRWEPVSVGAQ